MYVWAIPTLTFVSVVALGGAYITTRAARRRVIQQRLMAVAHDLDAVSQQSDSILLGLLNKVGRLVAPSGASQRLKQQLTRAGYFNPAATTIYLGLKFTAFVLGLAGLGLMLMPLEMQIDVKVVLVMCGAAALSFIPNVVVGMRRSARNQHIRNHLPDAVDLLEICVTSGMGLDMAWNAVTEEIRHVSSVLADEMSLTNLESHLGASRAASMRHMAERTGADELSSLAAMLTQSERFGTSIGDALRVFAASMRETRRQRAEENAEKMAVKLLFPLVLFIFPSIIVVTVGPAGIKLAQLFAD